MRLFCWRAGFKIRSKADAAKLLNMIDDPDFGRCETELYWHDDHSDYYISPKRREVYERPIFCRGNIFDPYIQEPDPIETIWKARKYLNAQIFS